MTGDAGTPRYEIRGGSLYVNQERQSVSEESILAGAAIHRATAKDPVDWAPGQWAQIPEELGRLILSLEARKAVRELAEALAPLLTA
jgi:hypothetical protein